MKIDSQREIIVFGRAVDWDEEAGGGIVPLDIDVDTAQELVDEGYLDPSSRQNESPTAAEMIELVDTHGGVLHGYMVSPHRDDARITLTSFTVCDLSVEEVTNKYHPDTCHQTVDGTHAWWD